MEARRSGKSSKTKSGFRYRKHGKPDYQNRGTTFSPQDLDNSARLAWGDDGGRTLQRSLNQAGNVKEGYEPLKEDNVIGEKTTSAFNSLKEEDEDGLLASLDKTII